MTVAYRPARTTDQSYITNSWVTSLFGPKRSWGDRGMVLNRQVNQLLDDKRTRVIVACDSADPDAILGWIASANVPVRVLEFVHVRRQRRREGIATELVKRAELGPSFVSLFKGGDEAVAFISRISTSHAIISPEEFLP